MTGDEMGNGGGMLGCSDAGADASGC